MVAISMKCSMIGLTPFTYAYLSHVPTWSNSVISRGRRKTEGFDIVMSLMLSVRPSTARFVSLCLRRKSGLWLDRQHQKEHMFFMPRLGIIFFVHLRGTQMLEMFLRTFLGYRVYTFFFSTRILFFRSRLWGRCNCNKTWFDTHRFLADMLLVSNLQVVLVFVLFWLVCRLQKKEEFYTV